MNFCRLRRLDASNYHVRVTLVLICTVSAVPDPVEGEYPTCAVRKRLEMCPLNVSAREYDRAQLLKCGCIQSAQGNAQSKNLLAFASVRRPGCGSRSLTPPFVCFVRGDTKTPESRTLSGFWKSASLLSSVTSPARMRFCAKLAGEASVASRSISRPSCLARPQPRSVCCTCMRAWPARSSPTDVCGEPLFSRAPSVTVDGGEANDDAGGVRLNLSQDSVREFQINRSDYSAELGSASGASVNIVTKSGTDAIRGNLYGYFRDDAMDARDPFAFSPALSHDPTFANFNLTATGAPVKNSLSRQQFGATIGFPLRKDRTFLFLTYEGLRSDAQDSVPLLTHSSIFA